MYDMNIEPIQKPVTVQFRVEDIAITTSHPEKFTEAVERGIAALDQYFGHTRWVANIDINKLSLESVHACVCGQLFETDTKELDTQSGYDYAVKYLMEGLFFSVIPQSESDDAPSPASRASALGFATPDVREGIQIEFDLFVDNFHVGRVGRDHPMARVATRTSIHIANALRVGEWDLLTKIWREKIEARKKVLGFTAENGLPTPDQTTLEDGESEGLIGYDVDAWRRLLGFDAQLPTWNALSDSQKVNVRKYARLDSTTVEKATVDRYCDDRNPRCNMCVKSFWEGLLKVQDEQSV